MPRWGLSNCGQQAVLLPHRAHVHIRSVLSMNMRADRIAKHLNDGIIPEIDLVRVEDVSVSGITSISRVSDGNYVEYDPERIAATTQHLTGAQLDDYLDAVIDWWHFSITQLTLQHDPSTVVHTFLAECPECAVLIGMVSSEHDVSVARWLAPNR